MAAPRKYSDELRERATGMAIELLPGAGDEPLRLGPLIRPLIDVHWTRTRMVAEINGVASAELDLHRHLFGSDPILPPRPLRDGIAALQDGRYSGPVAGIARPDCTGTVKAQVRRPVTSRAMMVFMISLVPP
jgi:hypothetical protein